MGPRQICPICGEAFWRVQTEPPVVYEGGRQQLRDLVCLECAHAIDAGPPGLLIARNRLAPWGRLAEPGHVALHPNLELSRPS